MGSKRLAGLTVVAIEQAVAGPYCTSKLADAGARVIKIERPEGDFARFYDDATAVGSSYFVWLNRGKESVVLDLRKDTDHDALVALMLSADIVVQNLRPGALARLGLEPERLIELKPTLICCSITGYGDGPYASRKAYDLLIQAESGLASITGGPEEPSRVGVSIVDIATGATAHAAILEAVIVLQKTGRGSDIRISMFDVIADWLSGPLLCSEAGQPPKRTGLSHPLIVPYGAFETVDGRKLLIAVQNDREWGIFCRQVLHWPQLATDRRFATNVARVANRAETDGLVSKAFGALASDQVVALLAGADVAFAYLNDLSDLSRHPHLRRAQVDVNGDSLLVPAPPVLIKGEAPSNLGSVPRIGQHTESVLSEFTGGSVGERGN